MRKIKNLEIQRLFRKRLAAALEVVLVHPALRRELLACYRRCLIGTECGYC